MKDIQKFYNRKRFIYSIMEQL